MTSDQSQVVSLALYRFAEHRYWAFKQMQQGLSHFGSCDGLSFAKILGTGAGNGFSIWPNFGQYAMLCAWKSESAALAYFRDNDYQRMYTQKAANRRLFWMKPVFGHGQWDRREPFQYSPQAQGLSGPTAVITRATINTKRLIEFWRSVPSVSRGMGGQAGLQLAVGVGEWPLVQQATFSIWDDWESMKKFAYKGQLHKNVIQKTRERGWYKEELFARFKIFREE